MTRSVVILFSFSLILPGQHRVDPSNMHHRILAVVPLVGKGTWADPKRPMFAPLPLAQLPTDRTGILGFQHVLSDDGNLALVEFVAANKTAFAAILASTDPRVKVFEVGKHTRAEIEAEFKGHKASFNFDNFKPARVQ